MLTLIADRLVLKPTQHPVAAEGKSRRLVKTEEGHIEAWTQCIGATSSHDVAVFVLKFGGTGGRAERASYHPLDCWPDLSGEVWSVNPPGYGGSSGRATLRTLAAAGRAACQEIMAVANQRPVIVTGNSLGTVTALHVAARFQVNGLILRNPPPLRQLILGKFGWWNLWLGAALVSRQIPEHLCSIENAARCTAPALFVSSGKDRVVPPPYQAKIIHAYAGPKRLLRLRESDHATALSEAEQRRYLRRLGWLREQAIDVAVAHS